MATGAVPRTKVTTRNPKTEKFLVGEKREVLFLAATNKAGKPVWGLGEATITEPSGDVSSLTDIIEAEGFYRVPVEFDTVGIWQIVLTYGTEPASASEEIKARKYVRVVS